MESHPNFFSDLAVGESVQSKLEQFPKFKGVGGERRLTIEQVEQKMEEEEYNLGHVKGNDLDNFTGVVYVVFN